MSKLIRTATLAAFGLALTMGAAHARTDDETKAIVLKFNADAFGNGDKAALPGETADDFFEHHPTGAAQSPEGKRADFLAKFGKKQNRPAGAGAGGPPPPALVLVSGDYVLFVTKMNQPDPTAAGKTYEADWFDLFRVNADGKVAEHWDSGSVRAMPKGAPGGPPPG